MPKKSSKLKRSTIDKRKIAKKNTIAKMARNIFGQPKCGSKQIVKNGYFRSSYNRKDGSKVKGTWVPPTCIDSVSGTGVKGEQLFVLERGDLKRFGYEDVRNKTELQRHRALGRALSENYDALSLTRKLNALKVVNKNRDPVLETIFAEDAEWVKSRPEYLSRPTANRSKKGSKRGSKRGSKKGSTTA
jgi:hypothetical protein